MSELLDKLRGLEEDLHDNPTRRDADRLVALLHPDFEEIGRSGRRYSRAEVLAELPVGEELPPGVARDFALSVLAEGVALLTYRSAHVGDDGLLYRHTLRSSLWLETPSGWRLRFHQGTATGA